MGRGQGGGGGRGKIAGGGSATASDNQRTEPNNFTDSGIPRDTLTDGLVGQELTADEETAINQYTRAGYQRVNAAIGGYDVYGETFTMDRLRPNEKNIIDNLPTALSKLPAYEGVSYRSININKNIDTFIKDYKPGQGVEIATFMSTTTDKSRFGISKALSGDGVGNEVIYTIRGKRGRDVANRSANTKEAEVLFTRSSRFKVVSVEPLAKGGYHVTLEQ